MARTRDKTDEFKEAVRTIASAQGFDEVWRLQAALGEQVTKYSQQEFDRLQNAIEATQNVQKGNKALAKAIERNSSSRTFLLLFLVVLPLSLLFLDWYQ